MAIERIQVSNDVVIYSEQSAENETLETKMAGSIFNIAGPKGSAQNGGPDKGKTIEALNQEIASGNAQCINQFQYLFRQCDRHKHITAGSFIMLDRVPDGCRTLGDVKRKLHLPDGCLRNNIPKLSGGGNFDEHEAEAPLSISVDALAAGLGISPSEIKELFK